ncbi:uncharacterized protein LOC144447607 isoform X3 [Glandiceps talaboti]
MKMYSVLICLVVVTAVAGTTTYMPREEPISEDNSGMSCYYCSDVTDYSDCGSTQDPYSSNTRQCDSGNGWCMTKTYWEDGMRQILRDCTEDCWAESESCHDGGACTTCCYGNNCNEKHADDNIPIMGFAPSTGPTMMVTMAMSLIAFFML